MSLFALFADKGSPGVTTLGLALAVTWPRPVTLVECDPAGGDLALRLTDSAGRPQLRTEPSLLTLAAAVRRDPASPLWEHGQPVHGLPAGASVVAGVRSPEQAAGLAELWPAIAGALSTTGEHDIIADLGRLHPGSPALEVAAAADVLVGVTRSDAPSVLRLRDRLGRLHAVLPGGPSGTQHSTTVVVATDRTGDEAVEALRTVLGHAGLPVTVAGFLAVDAGAVETLQRGAYGPRLARSLLLRSAQALAHHLTGPQPSVAAATGAVDSRRRPTTLAWHR